MEMAMIPKPAAFQSLPGALKAGKITQAELDAAVRPILENKIRMGLFEHPYVDVAKADAVLADPEHIRLARVAAERSAVLLRNVKQVLPPAQRKNPFISVSGTPATDQ